MDFTFDISVLLAIGIQEIIGAVFLILYVLGQLFAGREGAKEPAKPRRQRPKVRDQPAADAPAGGPPRDQAEALRNEVEQFLRRAQGKPPRSDEMDEPRPQPVRLSTPEVAAKPVPVKPEQPRRLVEAASAELRDEGVAEHVGRHIDTEAIAAHAASLGAEVGQADERVEAHLREKFDHQVGRLKHREVLKDDPVGQDVAGSVAAMLADPQGMRQLIVANEILRRPQW